MTTNREQNLIHKIGIWMLFVILTTIGFFILPFMTFMHSLATFYTAAINVNRLRITTFIAVLAVVILYVVSKWLLAKVMNSNKAEKITSIIYVASIILVVILNLLTEFPITVLF